MLTESQLKSIMPNCAAARMAACLMPLNAAMHRFQVNSVPRAAAFLAQLAHESGEFRWMEELWGREPTPAQRRYEPQSSLAAQLGNTQPGDGRRFKGRGPIQITGRANYRRYGGLLGVDLEAAPERAAEPDLAFAVAGLYWATNHLNELADAGQFVAITKRINGGTNGLADREKYHARAQGVLAGGTFGDEPPLPRGGARIELSVPLDELPPLPRGGEALRDEADAAAQADAGAAAPAAARRPAAKKAAARATTKKSKAGVKQAAAAGKATPAKQAAAGRKAGAKRTAGAVPHAGAGKAAPARKATGAAGGARTAGAGKTAGGARAATAAGARRAAPPAPRTTQAAKPARPVAKATRPAASAEPDIETATTLREAVAARRR